jgi:hypothetical protein
MNQIELIKSAWRRILLLALSSIFMISCASNMAWYNPQRTIAHADQDFRECKYDAAKYGYVPMHWGGDPIAMGIADGIEQAMRTNSIIKECMESKGYTLTNIHQIDDPRVVIKRGNKMSRPAQRERSERIAHVASSPQPKQQAQQTQPQLSASQRLLIGE